MTPRIAAVCGLLLLGACTDDLLTSETAQEVGCTKFLCGSNSPIVGGLPFFELDQTGAQAAPDSGLRIVGFTTKTGKKLKPSILGARLRGIMANNTVVEGAALVGSRLYLETKTGGSFRINIEAVAHKQRYWEHGEDGTVLESYELTWEQKPFDEGSTRLVCPTVRDADRMFTAPAHHALIYTGDRYDAATGKIRTGEADWFNVACAGDALSKLLVMRHAEVAMDADHETTPQQREAGIRMLRADYCGQGANTILGKPLDWENVGEWNFLNEAATLDNVEAIWGPTGAVCVSHPRHIALEELPCARPVCDQGHLDNWAQSAAFITINPLDP